MLKVGDRVTLHKNDQTGTATVKIGPYPLEFQAKYPDGTETTFIEDVYDLELESDSTTAIGIRRRYLKKVK